MILTDAEKKWIADSARNTLECHYRGDPRGMDVLHVLSEDIDLNDEEICICKSLIEKCEMY